MQQPSAASNGNPDGPAAIRRTLLVRTLTGYLNVTDTPDDNKTVVLGGAAQNLQTAAASIEQQNALPIGTRMGEFEIIGLVGEGGFGIVYLAQDHSLERKVALKEYMPASLASRSSNATVSVRSERLQETFEIGRRSFVNEARLLAQFDHPALVKVYRFWEANGTAYMAMPFYDGITLRDMLQRTPQAPDEAWLKKLLDPVTAALATIHAHNCFHRDIAPDNIMLLPDGRPVLLDFGAARRVISDMTQALTVILKPGYAPIEQYAEMPNMRQGAWTDIYALAAVIYYAIAKRLPPPSVSRIMQDSYEPLARIAAGCYSDAFLRGVDLCLITRPEQRPQSIAEMRELLEIDRQTSPATTQILISLPEDDKPAAPTAVPSPTQTGDSPRPATPHLQTPLETQQLQSDPAPRSRRGRIMLIGGLGTVVLVLGLAAVSWQILSPSSAIPALPTPQPQTAVGPTNQSASSTAQISAQPAATTAATGNSQQASSVPRDTPAVTATRLEALPDHTEPAAVKTAGAAQQSEGKKPASRAKKPENTENAYMHQVNKDLDDMLR